MVVAGAIGRLQPRRLIGTRFSSVRANKRDTVFAMVIRNLR